MSTNINLSDYQYELPAEKIAYHPLPERDSSKLLVYKKEKISHTNFRSLVDFIPSNATLFFNNTRVIPARLYFRKESGAILEIFLLAPVSPSSIHSITMSAQESCIWRCTIGNLKRWKDGTELILSNNGIELYASLKDREKGEVEFTWKPAHLSFAEILDGLGSAPLPPYIKRAAESSDLIRYQTVYAEHEGAVAAPTAGLHFTDFVLDSLKKQGVKMDFLTLHVSAGTFLPIKTSDALAHTMHSEQIVINRENLENILMENRSIIPVGTTSMRTLESIFWYGVKLLESSESEFIIHQNDPYRETKSLPTKEEAIHAVLKKIKNGKSPDIIGSTSIYIHPGYKFRVCEGIITNFHQPGSTLILLIAALIGGDWRKIYNEALNMNYRFLSYGDSSLLIP